MNTVFDLDKLRQLLKDFYEIAKVRITVFDARLKEIVSYPETVAPLCKLIRETEAGVRACLRCDRNACAEALEKRGTVIYQCHAGLTEAVMPLFADSLLVGYLLIGHVFAYESHEEGWREVSVRCEGLPLDREKLRELCCAGTLHTPDYIRSAAKIMHAVAAYLLLERMAVVGEAPLAERLNTLLEEQYTENVTAQSLCQTLKIGRTQLYKLSHQLYGCGIAEHLRRLRLDKAKRLLEKRPELHVSEIAAQCGFSDYNYFIAVFSRENGCSPGAYRRRMGERKREK